jgi:hypothetical protein
VTLPAELAAFALLGVLGSAHCAGMCGGFACVAVGGARRSRRGRALDACAYAAGKALTYAVLGLALSAAARAATGDAWTRPELARRALAWLAGGALVLAGLASLGLRAPLALARASAASAVTRGASRFFAAARSLPGASGPLAVGLLTGALPCGLSWSALALASQASPAGAFLGPLVFGLATAPALLVTAFAGRALLARLGPRAPAALGVVLVLLGGLTIWRGGAPGDVRADGAACCSSD